MTHYEKLILDIVRASHSHPSAQEIFFLAKQKDPKISFATVYNNLHKLVANGEIKKINMDDGADRYDDTTPHAHLHCVKCGEIRDYYYDDSGDQIRDIISKHDGNVLSIDLKIDYVCEKCREKENIIEKEN